jgi:hypothetical protein
MGSNREGDIPETATTTQPTTKMSRMKTTTMTASTMMKKRVGTMDDMDQNKDRMTLMLKHPNTPIPSTDDMRNRMRRKMDNDEGQTMRARIMRMARTRQ